ncbi:peptidase M20 [Salipiger pallidus]|uniref:Peptidase M20 n=1 Tax=Salipiger pallidus TaxID=1775170 RepID=A0A8J3EG60_9RHOB|nr:M20 family metallopeptidase [Salipiger pallidus]GGG65184.1 peptidase M20 [Salipiger pallidus]
MTLSNDPTAEIKALTAERAAHYIGVRRDLHMHPELAFEEHRTAAKVADELRRIGLSPRIGVGRTGVVADIEGGRPGPRLLIRADMDALPIHERTGLPYASQIDGKMHACGHDIHTATLLGVGEVLHRMADQLSGSVRLVFQPAEEAIGGAREMIADGILEGVDMALGLHNRPEIAVGSFGIVEGFANASVDTFDLTIHGKSGHAARSYAALDPIVVAAQFINQVQTVISRDVRALESCVISIGSIHAGEARNVIPGSCTMTGTIRSRHPEARATAERRLRQICAGLETGTGAGMALTFVHGTPGIRNEPKMLAATQTAIEHQFGDVALRYEPSMGGEDFALIAEAVPSFRLLVGSSQPGRNDRVHNDDYQPDERCIAFGTEALARASLDLLR